MQVTIKKAFQDVMSSKYNKFNLLCGFFLLITVFFLFDFAVRIDTTYSKYLKQVSLIVLSIIIYGYIAITANNDIKGKSSVFPSIRELPNIISVGFKFFIGQLVLVLPVVIIQILIVYYGIIYPLISSGHATPLPYAVTLCLVCLITLFLYLFYYVLALDIIFCQTFSLKFMLKLSNAKDIKQKKKKLYESFINCVVIISVLMSIINKINYGIILVIIISITLMPSLFAQAGYIEQNPENAVKEG